MLAPVTLDPVDGRESVDVQLAGTKRAFFHIVAIDGVKDDGVQSDTVAASQ